jgi:hypothetical protein
MTVTMRSVWDPVPAMPSFDDVVRRGPDAVLFTAESCRQ